LASLVTVSFSRRFLLHGVGWLLSVIMNKQIQNTLLEETLG